MTDLEGGVFAEVAVGEDEQELGTLSSLVCGLKRVGNTGREVPEIARALHPC